MPITIERDPYNYRKFLGFLFTQKHLLFLQKSCTSCSSKRMSSALFFSGNFDSFHGTEPQPQSMTCDVGIRGAGEKTRCLYRHSWHENQASPSTEECVWDHQLSRVAKCRQANLDQRRRRYRQSIDRSSH